MTRTAQRARTLALAASALALAAACQTNPRLAGRDTQVLTQGPLAAENPTDIAIAPVESLAPGLDVPTRDLRQAAAATLVTKLYSPIALARVDESLGEPVAQVGQVGTTPARYRKGALREDAVLEIIVHGWDDSLWSIRRSLVVDVEARLVDPGDFGGTALWAGRLMGKRFDLTDATRMATTDEQEMRIACRAIMREILAKLPSRDPEVGPRDDTSTN